MTKKERAVIGDVVVSMRITELRAKHPWWAWLRDLTAKHFYERCPHPNQFVIADLLEGGGRDYAVQQCTLCGACRRVAHGKGVDFYWRKWWTA